MGNVVSFEKIQFDRSEWAINALKGDVTLTAEEKQDVANIIVYLRNRVPIVAEAVEMNSIEFNIP